MARFLTGNQLNAELENLFERAERYLLLISPFIKLHDRYISTLRAKMDNPKLQIVIVFGKNPDNYSKSMKLEDFNFFREFPNIEIRYERRLHAKYYASEHASLLTSMNLYTYSQDNNIEAGIIEVGSSIGDIAKNIMGEESIDLTADAYFKRVVRQADLLYKKTPLFEPAMLGLSKKYVSSKVEVDKLSEFFLKKGRNVTSMGGKMPEIPEPLITNTVPVPQGSKTSSSNSNNYSSTSSLAKEIGVSSKDLFFKFEKMNWIQRKDDNWILTASGLATGALIKKGHYGDYIAWPKRIISELPKRSE